MKFKACALSGLAFILFLSAGTEKTSLTKGYRVGDKAPAIEPEGNEKIIDFSNSKNYSLVNFWAAYDANSRVRNMQLWNKVKELNATVVNYYSVSMDEYQSVFEETLKTDNLDAKNHFYIKNDKKSSVYKNYGLKKGFRNFLIDKEGVIIAINIPPGKLSEIIKSN